LLQRSFTSFPDGLPGLGLLLLRGAVGVTLLFYALAYFVGWGQLELEAILVAVVALASGVLLLIGLVTPVATALAALMSLGAAFAWFATPLPNILSPDPASAFVTLIAISLLFLGPGAFSLDARRYGRREIIIPPIRPRSFEE
jgi:uncharacterized membrane protein YphA (DoxX/SURF4 family)